MYNLKDKIVFVSGGAIGIGAITVQLFLDEGAKHVTFTDVNENAGEQLEKELKSSYEGRVEFIKSDVTNDEELFAVYKKIIDDHGFIDVVVNNAGIMNDSQEVYKKALNVNVTALVTSTLKAWELMRTDRAGRGGVIINVSSIAALTQGRYLPIYFGAKSAVLQFSMCMGSHENYEKTGVKVITMCYGATGTNLLKKGNLEPFDKELTDECFTHFQEFSYQSAESAAKGLIEACQRGESGSAWLVKNDKPAVDITPVVKKAYSLLTEVVIN